MRGGVSVTRQVKRRKRRSAAPRNPAALWAKRALSRDMARKVGRARERPLLFPGALALGGVLLLLFLLGRRVLGAEQRGERGLDRVLVHAGGRVRELALVVHHDDVRQPLRRELPVELCLRVAGLREAELVVLAELLRVGGLHVAGYADELQLLLRARLAERLDLRGAVARALLPVAVEE